MVLIAITHGSLYFAPNDFIQLLKLGPSINLIASCTSPCTRPTPTIATKNPTHDASLVETAYHYHQLHWTSQKSIMLCAANLLPVLVNSPISILIQVDRMLNEMLLLLSRIRFHSIQFNHTTL
jgi:hypothetical protein